MIFLKLADTISPMAKLIKKPTIIAAEGRKPKQIAEYIGRVNTATPGISVARMKSASGWTEPGQTPEFDEYTLVLAGAVTAETKEGIIVVNAGEALHAPSGQWIRYSTPGPEGADYVSVCIPAFAPDTVHRDS